LHNKISRYNNNISKNRLFKINPVQRQKKGKNLTTQYKTLHKYSQK